MNGYKKMFHKIMEFKLEGADTYYNHGSTWIILTDKKQWVIELTKDGTLWYNFYFFQSILTGMMGFEDTVKNENYITEWVENFIQNGVKRADGCQIGISTSIEDAIQNGVKDIKWGTNQRKNPIEDTIQNGVQKTTPGGYLGSVEMKGNMVHQFEHAKQNDDVEDTIQNGVKETKHNTFEDGLAMEDAIQNGFKNTRRDISGRQSRIVDTIRDGVKRTELGGKDRKIDEIKDIVENGIKETESIASHRTWKSEEVIQNGIKETNPHFLEIMNPINFEPVIKEMKRMNEVNIVLDKGIKEIKELPDKSGELRGYGDYYNRQEDGTKPHTQYIDDVIRNGIKETKYCELHSLMRADHIIRDGIKETKSVHIHNGESIDSVIQDGVKKTYGQKHKPLSLGDVIQNGIKETQWRKVDNHPTYVDKIISK